MNALKSLAAGFSEKKSQNHSQHETFQGKYLVRCFSLIYCESFIRQNDLRVADGKLRDTSTTYQQQGLA